MLRTLLCCYCYFHDAINPRQSSLWKQRAHRWTVSALRITGKSLYSFFTYDTRGGLLSNIAFRLYRCATAVLTRHIFACLLRRVIIVQPT
jgi:hypothetical protein